MNNINVLRHITKYHQNSPLFLDDPSDANAVLTQSSCFGDCCNIMCPDLSNDVSETITSIMEDAAQSWGETAGAREACWDAVTSCPSQLPNLDTISSCFSGCIEEIKCPDPSNMVEDAAQSWGETAEAREELWEDVSETITSIGNGASVTLDCISEAASSVATNIFNEVVDNPVPSAILMAVGTASICGALYLNQQHRKESQKKLEALRSQLVETDAKIEKLEHKRNFLRQRKAAKPHENVQPTQLDVLIHRANPGKLKSE